MLPEGIKNARAVPAERYEDLYDGGPIIFISKVDEQKVFGGFALCEPDSENEVGVVLRVLFELSDQYFECLANVKPPVGSGEDCAFIKDARDYAYSRGMCAVTVKERNPRG